jgi:hypothetical protein
MNIHQRIFSNLSHLHNPPIWSWSRKTPYSSSGNEMGIGIWDAPLARLSSEIIVGDIFGIFETMPYSVPSLIGHTHSPGMNHWILEYKHGDQWVIEDGHRNENF